MNSKGRPIRGVVAAANEVDLHNQLQSAGLELIHCAPLQKKKDGSLKGFHLQKIRIRDLIQFFIHLEQMQGAGVPLLDGLADIRDTTDNDQLRDVMSEIYRDVTDGSAFSEAMSKHPKVFTNLYISLIKAGEDTGDLTSSYRQLIKYLKWVDAMQSMVRKATRYPMIVTGVVLLTVVIMMGYVVPQIVDFIKNLDQELPIYTIVLIEVSNFFKSPLFYIYGFPVVGGAVVILTPILLLFLTRILCKISDGFAYKVDVLLLKVPVAGVLIRKITIARYAQTFGALFAAGIDVMGSLRSARNTVSNRALIEALESVESYVQSGTPLSESFNACGEFPSMVIRMLRIGEETGNLTAVLDQVSEFYTKDVDEAVQAIIAMIEPALTALLGGMILWIAVGVFGPIYANFENIDF